MKIPCENTPFSNKKGVNPWTKSGRLMLLLKAPHPFSTLPYILMHV